MQTCTTPVQFTRRSRSRKCFLRFYRSSAWLSAPPASTRVMPGSKTDVVCDGRLYCSLRCDPASGPSNQHACQCTITKLAERERQHMMPVVLVIGCEGFWSRYNPRPLSRFVEGESQDSVVQRVKFQKKAVGVSIFRGNPHGRDPRPTLPLFLFLEPRKNSKIYISLSTTPF